MYTGVLELINDFKEPFDPKVKATKKAKRIITERGDKVTKELLKEEVDLILQDWEDKRTRGIKMQKKLCERDLKVSGSDKVFLEERINETKYGELLDKELNKLNNNTIYLEKLLFSNKYKILGYADKVFVKKGTINIIDNKVIDKLYRTSSYVLDNGHKVPGTKMYAPLDHLDSCNYNDYVLQLSLYMYLAWENNKHLKIGKLYIRHIKMSDKDKIISDKLIEVPYLKQEVKKLLKYKLLNDE